MARVFVSCARDDQALASDVCRQLEQAGHEVVPGRDTRDVIVSREHWRRRLDEWLGWADAVVCVVTSASVASSRCIAEIATAQARGKCVLPLRAGLDHPLLADVKYTDLAHDPAAAWAALVEAVRRSAGTEGGGWPAGRSPFPGLRPFDSDEQRVFFGRDEESRNLAERVRCATGRTAVLVMGPSGCGKSSLVRAGLLPRMADEPGWRALPPLLPGTDPIAALARGLATAAQGVELHWRAEHVERRLDAGGLTTLADELLLLGPGGPRQRLLIVVDQFEELLTRTPPGPRARFVELLRPALTGPVLVVGTLRPEFLDPLLADPDLGALVDTDIFPLRPLHREALRLVIDGPARLAAIDVPDDLVARLVQDTGGGEALPLLAFTLAQLAEGMGRDGQLSVARYEQLGGVQQALAGQADAALADAVAAGGRSRGEVISGLLRLVSVDGQGGLTSCRVRRDELPAPVVADLDAFIARRLLITGTDGDGVSIGGPVTIGLAHEAFLLAWPPLAEVIAANVSALRTRRAVEQAATEWDGHGRAPARLWSGNQLAAAVISTGARIRPGHAAPPGRRDLTGRRHRVLVTDRVELSSQARDFLHASIRHDRSRRRRAITVLSVLLVPALVAAIVAIVAQHRTEQRQLVATSGQLVGQAEAARSTDLRAALLLGLAAHQLHPTGETQSSLATTLAAGPYLGTLTGHKGSVEAVAFAPDGHTLATGGADSTVILWELAEPSRPQPLGPPLTGHRRQVNSVAFAPDGRTLATGSGDGTVLLWDVTDRAQPRQLGPPLTGHTDWVNSVAFAPDGRTLVTGSDDATVRLWDVADPARPGQLGSPLTGYAGSVTSLALTPDGRTLITASADTLTTDSDTTIILWEIADRDRPRRLGPPLTRSPSLPFEPPSGLGKVDIALAVAPDGRTFVTSGDVTGTAVLWDLTDPAQPRQLGAPLSMSTGSIGAVAFAPSGRTLATGSLTGSTMLWDVTDPFQPYPLRPPLTGHRSSVNEVAFAPDGRTLVAGSTNGTAIRWDLTDPAQPRQLTAPLTGHRDLVQAVAFAPDGRTLATGSNDETVILWDVADPVRPRRLGPPLTGHSSQFWWSLAFAPDGHILATSGADNTVILWDLRDRAHPRQLGAPFIGNTNGVLSVAFAPDGATLAVGSSDIVLWDVTDPVHPRRLDTPLTGRTGRTESVAFAPDGQTLVAAGTDGTVTLWDVADRTHPRLLDAPLTGHTEPGSVLAFAPDGRTLATVGRFDGTLILWDVTDPNLPRRLGTALTNNLQGAWSVAFAPDGGTLAVGSFDTVLWDVTDRTHPRPRGMSLPNQSSSVANVLSVAFAPDGRTLATGNGDSTATLWDLTDLTDVADHVVQRACAATGGGLDRQEWDRYLPDLPYQNTCPS